MPPSRTGLAAEYLFSGHASDSSGSGRHGVVHGATRTADRFGNPDSAFRFDGVDDYIEISPPPALTSDHLTVSAWARFDPRDFSSWTNCVISQDNGDDEDQSRRVFQLSLEWGHVIWHRMMNTRDPMYRRQVRPERWYHLAAVHENGVNRLYVDGVLQDTVEHLLWTNPSQPLHIGRKGTAEPNFFFRGTIDDVRIYNRALTDSEIRELTEENGWQVPPIATISTEADPVSGRWAQWGNVFLDLKLEDGGVVTGTVMGKRPDSMAPISVGIFDRVTGEIRLEGEARDPDNGPPVAYVIAGIVDAGVINVEVRFSNFSGNFVLRREGAV